MPWKEELSAFIRKHRQETEKLEMEQIFKLSKSTLYDILSPATTHLLAIPGSATHWRPSTPMLRMEDTTLRSPHMVTLASYLGKSVFHADPGPLCKGKWRYRDWMLQPGTEVLRSDIPV